LGVGQGEIDASSPWQWVDEGGEKGAAWRRLMMVRDLWWLAVDVDDSAEDKYVAATAI
jgi:hypothetical protein